MVLGREKEITSEQVRQALQKVTYPGYSRDIVAFGMVKNIQVQEGNVRFSINFNTQKEEVRQQILTQAKNRVLALEGISEVIIETAQPYKTPTQTIRPGTGQQKQAIPGINHIIAVASGKGGVGKSTVAVNLAVALAQIGIPTGLLDADIYGPSIPLMMGIEGQPQVRNEKMVPPSKFGVFTMSIGFIVPAGSPVIWRGPMVHQALQQFIFQVDWGKLSFLVIDLPPGTGDAQLSLTQSIALSGGIIVTTPQDVALVDARKGVGMFQTVGVPILGIIENMSFYICPHCHNRTDIFKHGGGHQASGRLGVPFLGEIPIDPTICIGGDAGKPVVADQPESPQAQAFLNIAERIMERLPEYTCYKD